MYTLTHFLQLRVKASDQRIPEKSGTGYVSVTVRRDRSKPYFLNEPYVITVNYTEPVGSSILQIQARDDTLTVSKVVILIGMNKNYYFDKNNLVLF